jgi:hypothetical protein
MMSFTVSVAATVTGEAYHEMISTFWAGGYYVV